MEGRIINFRRAVHHTYKRQMIAKLDGINTKAEAIKLVGKTALWESPAKRIIKGVVSSAHGSNGAVRIIFEKGLPGQAVGTKIKIN